MSLALVAFVAVTLLAESAFVLAVLALEVVRARVEVRSLVGKLRVEVCFAAAAAFALDGTAERRWREAAGRSGCWCCCWRSVGRSRKGGVSGRRGKAVVGADRIRRAGISVSVAAGAGLAVVVVVGGHASLEGEVREGVFESLGRDVFVVEAKKQGCR